MPTDDLVEPVAVPDIFISGVSHYELIGGGVARCVCYTNQRDDDGVVRRRISARVVIPLDALPDAIRKAIAAASSHVADHVTRYFPHAMH